MRWVVIAALAALSCREPRRLPTTTPMTTRAPAGPPFSCAGSRCVEGHPRLPDDGEWTCADSAGVTVCVGGEPAAGVFPGPPDPHWACGARQGSRADHLGARICVDPTPDFPDGNATGWRCRTQHEPPLRRVCDRDTDAWTLGAACGAGRPCATGSRCLDGRCALPDREPDCWLDGDCPSGRCRFGRCDGARP